MLTKQHQGASPLAGLLEEGQSQVGGDAHAPPLRGDVGHAVEEGLPVALGVGVPLLQGEASVLLAARLRGSDDLPAEPPQVAGALHVPLAEVAGAVPGLLQPLRPVGEPGAQAGLVVVHRVGHLEDAVGVGQQPGHQAGPGG